MDPRPLNTVTVYVLAPALVFHSLAVSDLSGGSIVRVVVGGVAFTGLMALAGENVGRVADERDPLVGALVPSPPSATPGTSASPSRTSHSATWAARRPSSGCRSSRSCCTRSASTSPPGPAAPAGWPASGRCSASRSCTPSRPRWRRALDVVPPADTAGMEALGLVGDSAIPVMLLVLGLQLARTNYGPAMSGTGPATVLRLGVAPVVGLGVALAVGFEDATVARVFVVECAMPAAVTPIILTVEFAADSRAGGVSVPEYVSTCVLVTTLLSAPLLTGLIALLQSGVVL